MIGKVDSEIGDRMRWYALFLVIMIGCSPTQSNSSASPEKSLSKVDNSKVVDSEKSSQQTQIESEENLARLKPISSAQQSVAPSPQKKDVDKNLAENSNQSKGSAKSSEQKGTDWPCFLGPMHNSSSSETGILTNWSGDGLKILWQISMGIGYAPIAIAKGKLYHFDREGDHAALTCREADSGKLIWKTKYATEYTDYYGYDPGPRAGPVVDGDRVYVHGVEGMLICYSADSGKEVWRVDTKNQYHFHQNFFGVGSSPIIENDLIIVPVGGSKKGEERPDDFRKVEGNGTGLIAFDKFSGKEKYASSNALASYSSPVIVSQNSKRFGYYFARQGLFVFEPQRGEVLAQLSWRARSLESVNAANPIFFDEYVFLSECYEKGSILLKFDTKNGQLKKIWSDEDKERDEKSLMCHWNTPIYDNGYIYGCSGRHESQAELRCIVAKTGEIKWRKPGLSRSSLLKVDGYLLCLTERGQLYLLKINPKKFESIAQMDVSGLGYPCWAAPILSHGKLYLRGSKKLYCLQLGN